MRVLLIRDRDRPIFFDDLVAFLREQPDLDVKARSLLDPMPPFSDIDVVMFLLLDPADNRDIWPRAVAMAEHMEGSGVPVFRHPKSMPYGRKLKLAELVGGLAPGDIHVPKMVPVPKDAAAAHQVFDALTFPAFIRENHLHAGDLLLADTAEAAHKHWPPIVAKMQEPIAVEFIETRNGDGLYRKYRTAVVGGQVLPLHLQVSERWLVHGDDRLYTPAVQAEEGDFLARKADLRLQTAAAALAQDYCAFDHAYIGDKLVIWEVNPSPALRLIGKDGYVRDEDGQHVDLRAREAAARRVFAATADALRRRAAGD